MKGEKPRYRPYQRAVAPHALNLSRYGQTRQIPVATGRSLLEIIEDALAARRTPPSVFEPPLDRGRRSRARNSGTSKSHYKSDSIDIAG